MRGNDNLKAYKNDVIMLFGDTHFPYTEKGYLKFLVEVKNEFEPERIFHMGDLTDQYVFSSYAKIPEADSLSQELGAVRKMVKQLGSLFPDLTILSSNHDDRVYKRARLAGIPKELIYPYHKLIGADNFNWRWVHDYTLRLPNKQHLYLTHHRSGSAFTMCQKLGLNVAVGHMHTQAGCQYMQTPTGLRWGANVPCLIDDNHYAFGYNKMSIVRPILGCTMVINSHPLFIPYR